MTATVITLEQSLNALLTTTLECIAREAPGFDESFKLAEQILESYGETNIAQVLYGDIDPHTKWKPIADLLGILIWSTSDNGEAIMRTAEGWLLRGTDIRRIRIAVNLDVYPFNDAATMESVFSEIATRYPTMECELSQLINDRSQNAR